MYSLKNAAVQGFPKYLRNVDLLVNERGHVRQLYFTGVFVLVGWKGTIGTVHRNRQKDRATKRATKKSTKATAKFVLLFLKVVLTLRILNALGFAQI